MGLTIALETTDKRSEPSLPPRPPLGADEEGGDGGWRLVPVAAYRFRWEAELARGYLEEEGIPATVGPGAGTDPYPSLAAVGDARVQLLVPEGQVAKAKDLLAQV